MTKDKANMSYGSANLTKVKSLQLSEYSKTILDYLGLSDFLCVFGHYDQNICFENSITKLVCKQRIILLFYRSVSQ